MINKSKPSQLVLALMLTGLPLLSIAAENIVAPPAPPAGVSAKSDAVIAPQAVSDVRAGAIALSSTGAVQPPDMLNVVLPSPPKPADLLPPAIKSTAKAKAHAVKTDAGGTSSTARFFKAPEDAEPAVVDPFASLTTTPVSDSQLNRFVFPEKVEGIYFPEGTPLPTCSDDAAANDPCKPVFLNNRQMMLLQLKAGAKGPIQMLVHFHSGRMVTLNLAPGNGPGAIVRVDGAEDGVSDARVAVQQNEEAGRATNASATRTESEIDVDLISQFAKGAIPAGFESIKVGAATRFSQFDVIPLATWSNGAGLRAHLMQVQALTAQPVAINPGLFRAKNVKGLALDRETITDKAPAMLYLLEQVKD